MKTAFVETQMVMKQNASCTCKVQSGSKIDAIQFHTSKDGWSKHFGGGGGNVHYANVPGGLSGMMVCWDGSVVKYLQFYQWC